MKRRMGILSASSMKSKSLMDSSHFHSFWVQNSRALLVCAREPFIKRSSQFLAFDCFQRFVSIIIEARIGEISARITRLPPFIRRFESGILSSLPSTDAIRANNFTPFNAASSYLCDIQCRFKVLSESRAFHLNCWAT